MDEHMESFIFPVCTSRELSMTQTNECVCCSVMAGGASVEYVKPNKNRFSFHLLHISSRFTHDGVV